MGGGNPPLEIVLGTIPLLVTLFIHGVGMHLVQRQFEVRGVRIYRAGRHGEFFFGAMILAMLATHLVEMLVWAATVNSLEAIPGFRTRLSLGEMRRVLRDTRCVMIGQTDEIAPADRRLYALRDVTGTVESIPRICASILSSGKIVGSAIEVVASVLDPQGDASFHQW